MGSKRFKMPSTMVLLVIMVVIFTVLTWVLPAGTYDRFTNSNGVEQVDPESYHEVESTPVGAWRIVTSHQPVCRSKRESSSFCYLWVVLCRLFLPRGSSMRHWVLFSKNWAIRTWWAVPVLIIFFAALSCIGINTAMLSFVPIGLMISKSLKLDNLVGVSIVMMGVCCGWSAGPFSANTHRYCSEYHWSSHVLRYWFRLLTMAIFLLFIAPTCIVIVKNSKRSR